VTQPINPAAAQVNAPNTSPYVAGGNMLSMLTPSSQRTFPLRQGNATGESPSGTRIPSLNRTIAIHMQTAANSQRKTSLMAIVVGD
jgi:hypothetical protein